jgi:TRAP-type mannitol/chloroaromatic compound transport system permease small subunit
VLLHAVPYATRSAITRNFIGSDGLPYRFVIKAFLAATFLLLAMAAVSRLSRVIAALRLKT